MSAVKEGKVRFENGADLLDKLVLICLNTKLSKFFKIKIKEGKMVRERVKRVNGLLNFIERIFEDGGEHFTKIFEIAPFIFGVYAKEGNSLINWFPEFLTLHIVSEKPALIRAFSKVLKTDPLFKYTKDGLLVFEWLSEDPENPEDKEERAAWLKIEENNGVIRELQLFNS